MHELYMNCLLPLVFGFIQEQAQWIFRGQPLNTLEKQAPICKAETKAAFTLGINMWSPRSSINQMINIVTAERSLNGPNLDAMTFVLSVLIHLSMFVCMKEKKKEK